MEPGRQKIIDIVNAMIRPTALFEYKPEIFGKVYKVKEKSDEVTG